LPILPLLANFAQVKHDSMLATSATKTALTLNMWHGHGRNHVVITITHTLFAVSLDFTIFIFILPRQSLPSERCLYIPKMLPLFQFRGVINGTSPTMQNPHALASSP